MKCTTVRSKLAGYLDDVVESAARTSERGEMRQHLDSCAYCREELQRYRKLAVLLSRSPRALPPSDLAVRIKVAAAQAQHKQDLRSQWQRFRDRAEILLDNVLRPVTLPATGGFVSAILVFAVVLQLIAPGISVQAIPNDVPLNLMQPAELLTLSDSPGNWAPENHDSELALPHGLGPDAALFPLPPHDQLWPPHLRRARNSQLQRRSRSRLTRLCCAIGI